MLNLMQGPQGGQLQNTPSSTANFSFPAQLSHQNFGNAQTPKNPIANPTALAQLQQLQQQGAMLAAGGLKIDPQQATILQPQLQLQQLLQQSHQQLPKNVHINPIPPNNSIPTAGTSSSGINSSFSNNNAPFGLTLQMFEQLEKYATRQEVVQSFSTFIDTEKQKKLMELYKKSFSNEQTNPNHSASTNKSSGNASQKFMATLQEINDVQCTIFRCIRFYMKKNEVMELMKHHNPLVVDLVWNKIEKQNPVFFELYNILITLRDQITAFNTFASLDEKMRTKTKTDKYFEK